MLHLNFKISFEYKQFENDQLVSKQNVVGEPFQVEGTIFHVMTCSREYVQS